MMYSVILSSQDADSPWRVSSPDGKKVIVKTETEPKPFVKLLTADAARKLAADWSQESGE